MKERRVMKAFSFPVQVKTISLPQWNIMQQCMFIFISAFLIRSLTFYFYVQYNERYRQPDSMDYHISALGIATGNGMHHIGTKKPIFWRTPGYPAYLALFYKWYGLKHGAFNANAPAQHAAIWFQIFICSILPILFFLLALLITNSYFIAWLTALFFIFHTGFILASCYLLTDAISILFFAPFLIALFYLLKNSDRINNRALFLLVALAALSLAGYTWLRPNGQWIAIGALPIFFALATSIQKKIICAVLFISIFFAALSPWFIRNYRLTGTSFFCPMSGPYLLSFSVPKIIRRASGHPLDLCWKYALSQAHNETKQQELLTVGTKKVICNELICNQFALPWIYKYPHYFLFDWTREVLKTTFDLYASQLVAFANNSFTYDPLEEFLTEKLRLCLYKQPMHPFARLLAWIEFFFMIVIWIGIFAGTRLFIINPMLASIKTKNYSVLHEKNVIIWLVGIFLCIIVLGMTGGFGYARLRMPVEPLLVLLSLSWWLRKP